MNKSLKDIVLACSLVAAVAGGMALAMPASASSAAATTTVAQATQAAHERPIHDAARLGSQQDVSRLLQSDPSQRDARTLQGATPLHHAAMNADPGPLKALLAAGANPNARDNEGRTPLHMAAFATRTPQALLLLRAGADPTLKTEGGRDVLSLARKVRADVLAGEFSLWILKGCSKERPC